MNALIQIFIKPGDVFEQQREDSNWLLPALVILGFSIVSAIAVVFATDTGEAAKMVIDQQIAVMEQQNVPQETIDQTRAQMENAIGVTQNPAVQIGGVLLSTFIMFVVLVLLHGLYFLIAGKIMGLDQGFTDWLALSCWGRMPWVIGAIVILIASFAMSSQADATAFNLLGFSNWVSLPNQDHMFVGALVKSLDILVLWSIAIMTIGFQKWSGKSMGVSLSVVAAPYVVIYGVLMAI